MKHVGFFQDFLDQEVNLNKSRLKRLNEHVDAVKDFLSEELDGFEEMESQGSYALRTIIKPVSDTDEYDADVLLHMTTDAEMAPSDYINAVYDCFRSSSTYKDKVHRRTRCVMLDYAGDFHLDVVPCIRDADGNHWICNKKTDEFEPTDGTGYRDWFNKKSGMTNGHLKRVTRLLKFLRDHKRTFSVKSILMTTLVGRTVEDDCDGTEFKSIPDALRTVVNRLNDFLQSNPLLPVIENPVLPGEDFTRHWDQAKYTNFRAKFDTYTKKINEAYDCKDHDESIDKWRDIFGDKFGKKRSNDSKTTATSGIVGGVGSAVITPRKPYAR